MKSVFNQLQTGMAVAVLLSSCISPLDFDAKLSDNNLVVEGFITNNFGPHPINITRLAKFAGDQEGGAFSLVNDAEVYLIDGSGERVELSQEEQEVVEIVSIPTAFGGTFVDTIRNVVKTAYTTPETFRGEIGNTYTLNIILTNGRHYVSTPQTIPDGPEIDSLLLRFVKLPSADPVSFTSGIEVYTRWQDPPGEENLYMWASNRGTYRLNARPDLYVDPVTSVNMPKDCCNICYVRDPHSQIYIHSDLRSDGMTQTVLSAFIEDDGRRFGDLYHLEIRMFSVTPEAFEFHRLVRSQLQITGSIFDPPPAEIKSNFSNVEDPDEVVVGFFGAYHESARRLFIEPSIIEERQRPVVLRDDCRTLARATTEIPDFWEE